MPELLHHLRTVVCERARRWGFEGDNPPRPHVQWACLPAGGVHWRAKPDPLPEDEPDARV